MVAYRFIATLLLALFCASGCSKPADKQSSGKTTGNAKDTADDDSEDEDDGTDADTDDEAGGSDDETDGEAASSAPAPTLALAGTWKKACVEAEGGDPSAGAAPYIVETVVVTGNAYSLTTAFYADNACKTLDYTQKLSLTYKLGKAAAKVKGGVEIDFTLKAAKLNITSDQAFEGIKADMAQGGCAAKVVQAADFDVLSCMSPPTRFSVAKGTATTLTLSHPSATGTGQSAAERESVMDVTAYKKAK